MFSSIFPLIQVAASIPFDSTQDAFNSTDVQTALGEIRQHPVWDQDITTTATNATLSLNTASKGYQLINGSATGYSIQMPSALTIFIGQEYMIVNIGSQTITIKDSSGAAIFTLSQTSIGFLFLQAQGSAAGTWIYWQTFIGTSTGVVNYNITSTTPFTTTSTSDTIIPGMNITPQAGTYAIWYSSANTGSSSGQQLNCTVYKGAVAVSDSSRASTSTSNAHVFFIGTQTIVQFDGVSACAIYVNTNTTGVVPPSIGNSITINQRSLLMIRLGT